MSRRGDTIRGKDRVLAGLAILLLATVLATGAEEVILKSRHFVPALGLDESLRARVSAGTGDIRIAQSDLVESVQNDVVHVIIQLEDTPTGEQQAALADAGARLLSYIPNNAWLAGVDSDRLARVAGLPGVRAVSAILPQDKIAPAIREQGVNAFSLNADGRARLVALLFADVTLDAGVAAVEALGGACTDRDEADNCLAFSLPVEALYMLAACDCIKWIDQHCESVDLNDGVRAAIHVNPLHTAPYTLTGTGVVLGQWESGHPDGSHVDLAGRVTSVQSDKSVTDHATLVAGTMIGSGQLIHQYRGMATAATIVSFPDWENVTDLRKQYREAIERYDIDIANNSWGKVEWNVYRDYAGAMDGIVRGDLGKPISIVWAVGNEGAWGTILCTAVGKNIVAVGATNSDDSSLWSLSNCGPTEDRRIKPDVVSPGCESRNGRKIWSTLPGNRYGGDCGTSMATPSVSGTMALILEDWRGTHGGDPLPSTLKGLLMHTAVDLGTPGPDYAYGYGMIDAQAAVNFVRADTLDETVVEGAVGRQGQRDMYVLRVARDTAALKVTLVWDDYPADPLTARALVNDLDLVAIGPDGRQYYPWTLDPSWPQRGADRTRIDRTNNVEQVSVESPPAGPWRIAVYGAVVPQAPQSYSLLAGPGGLADVAPGAAILSITGDVGATVAEFDDQGNLTLQGALTTGTECAPPPGAFVIRGPDGSVAGYIDQAGNMCIHGTLSELSNCGSSGGGFAVKDWFGNTVACVDAAGNLYLLGKLRHSP